MGYPNEQPPGPEHPAGAQPAAASPGGSFFGAGQEWQQWFRLHRQGSRRPWRRSLGVGIGVAAGIAVLGVPLGLLWAWLTPGVPVVDAGAAGTVVTDPSPEQYIAADGWFTLLGIGFGLIVTVGSWLLLRRDRGPFLLLGVVGGALLAGRWVAPMAGDLLGRDAYDRWLATAAQGATYLAPPQVQALGPKLVPAFVAAIVLTLLAGWSNDPDLDQPGALPGYGANHPYPSSHADQGEPEENSTDDSRYGGPAPFGTTAGSPVPYREGAGVPGQPGAADVLGLPDGTQGGEKHRP